MRFLLAGAAAMALIGPAASAAAEPCVCLAGFDVEQAPLLAGVSLLPTRDDAPASEPTLGSEALSLPIQELSSPALFVWVDEAALGGTSAPAQKVLWCEGSDDPRCSPAHGTPVAPELSSPPPAGLASALPLPALPGLEVGPSLREGLRAARGTRRVPERPPSA